MPVFWYIIHVCSCCIGFACGYYQFAKFGAGSCSTCGYKLENISARCPECGNLQGRASDFSSTARSSIFTVAAPLFLVCFWCLTSIRSAIGDFVFYVMRDFEFPHLLAVHFVILPGLCSLYSFALIRVGKRAPMWVLIGSFVGIVWISMKWSEYIVWRTMLN